MKSTYFVKFAGTDKYGITNNYSGLIDVENPCTETILAAIEAFIPTIKSFGILEITKL